MSAQTTLDVQGNLTEHPLAELLVETTEAQLSGSLRLTNENEKVVIYISDGKIVFAASNSRRHRLFEILLKLKKLNKEQLASMQNFANDLELSKVLRSRGILSKVAIDAMFSTQIEEIIGSALQWATGAWDFNALIRIKESIEYRVDLNKILLDHARQINPGDAIRRFKSDRESFGPKPSPPAHLSLESHEAFILSRFEKSFANVSEIDALGGLPLEITRQALYSLWLGGFLFRQHWDSALSENTIARLHSARLRLKRADDEIDQSAPAAEQAKPEPEIIQPEPEVEIAEEVVPAAPPVDEKELLGRYLERIEGASNLYEVIGALPEDEMPSIKQKYFAQAKKYHPDLFYKQPDIHPRIQNAFTELAHAYETLKTQKSRDLYDFKMRKELAKMSERRARGMRDVTESVHRTMELAAENFEEGQRLLFDGDYEGSIAFFARAVHFNDSDPSYHAFYGKALSSSRKHQHKAEAELQTAIRLEPNNTTYRLMLAELFVHIGLMKRAEGELNRLLVIAPNDQEAIALLDSVRGK